MGMVKVNKRSAYFVFLISYIAILMIAMTSSLIFYSKINETINEETKKSKVAMIDQLMMDFENKVEMIHDIRDSIIFNRELEMFAKGVSIYSYQEIMDDLKNYRKSDIFVDSFIYLNNTDEILTSNIRMQGEKFYNLMYKTDGIQYTKIKDLLDQYHMDTYLPIQKIRLYEDQEVRVLPYIQSFPVRRNSPPVGQFMILLDVDKMGELINKFSWATNSFIGVIDKNNQLILASDHEVVFSEDFYKQLINQPTMFEYELENKAFKVIHNKSEKTGWQFVIATPIDIYFKEMNEFTKEAIAIFTIYLIGGMVIIYLLTQKNYKPIREIKEIISRETPLINKQGNEYEYIKQTMRRQFDNDKALKERIRTQIPIIRNDSLLKLLKGYELHYDQLDNWLASVQIIFKTHYFIVITIDFNLKSPFFQDTEYHLEESLSIARFIIENRGNELLEDRYESYFVSAESHQVTWLLNLKKGSADRHIVEQLKVQMDEIFKFMKDSFEIDITIGISSIKEGVEKIRECFDESKKACEYSRTQDKDRVICFKALESISFDYYYPVETEYQLTNLLKNGLYEESKKLIHTLFEINCESKKIGEYAKKCLVYELSETVMKVLNSVLVLRGEEPMANEIMIQNFTESIDVEMVKMRMSQMIDRIGCLAEDKVIGKTEKLVNSITTYILEAPENMWIDLNSLSKEFNITPQYISNIFKKYKNENIKDFISKNKLIVAKKLLVSTELSTKEISTRLGYANEAGILRLFKKYEGVTPGIYRINHKKIDE